MYGKKSMVEEVFFWWIFFLSSRNKQIKCLHTALTLYFLQKRLVNLFSHSWLVHKSVQWTEFRAIQLTLHSLERHTQKMPWEIILPLLSLPKLRSTKIIEKIYLHVSLCLLYLLILINRWHVIKCREERSLQQVYTHQKK